MNEITITKSIGFNLWKGNNDQADVQGSNYIYDLSSNTDIEIDQKDLNLIDQINKVPKDKYYEINIDKVFLDQGLKNIINEPTKYISLYLKKILSFIFIDINSTYPNYYHPLNYLPNLLFGITSIIGIVLSDKKSYQFNFLILFFITTVLVVSIFFILPRYKLAILPLQIIFSNILFERIKTNFFTK